MRVLLLKDVTLLGQRGDIKEVKPGYGRNFLIARGLAKPATAGALKEAETISAQREAERTVEATEFSIALKSVEGRTISITIKATEQGNLYRAVGKKQIFAALKDAGIQTIREDDIVTDPIKKIGEHAIELKRGDQRGNCTLTVTAKQ